MFTRRLQLESLENRYALAGNVTATIADGDLFLTGDADHNQIVVSRLISGDIELTGMSSTTINGSSSFPVVLSGLTGDVQANLLAGNDMIELLRPTGSTGLPGSVFANLGSGFDRFTMVGETPGGNPTGTFEVGGSVIVYGREGTDVIALDRVVAAGDILIYGGEDQDEVHIFDLSETGLTSASQIQVDASTGNDQTWIKHVRAAGIVVRDPMGVSDLRLESLQVSSTIELYMSIDSDVVEIDGDNSAPELNFRTDNLIIHTGNGNDEVHLDTAFVDNFTLYSGEGNEGDGHFGINIIDLTVTQNLFIDTAGGLDNVLLDHVLALTAFVTTGADSDGLIVLDSTFTDATFDTQDGGDVVGIHRSHFDNDLTVLLWLGDDSLWVNSNTVDEDARFDGGGGSNQYIDLGGNLFTRLQRDFI